MVRQNKKELILWESYNIIRNASDSDLDEIQILINRERTDRTRNNAGE